MLTEKYCARSPPLKGIVKSEKLIVKNNKT